MTQQDEFHLRARSTSVISQIFFWGIHASCLLAFVVPFSWKLVLLALAGYVVRMWAITAGYHRYFSHRTYKTSRAFQFVLGWIGAASVQKGPIWWASTHRIHHKHSDTPEDVHSPIQRGFWYSHMGWILTREHENTNLALVKDLSKYPELRFIDLAYWLPPVTYALLCYALMGFAGLVWGFSISTVLLWHGTFTINSLSHVWGSRRYETTDHSRNNPVLALITLGEGWHNNHHHYQGSAAQGFFWWEVDVSYYSLKVLSWLGIVWDVRTPPEHVRNPALVAAREEAARARKSPLGHAEALLAELRASAERLSHELEAGTESLRAEYDAKVLAVRAELAARRDALGREWVARRDAIAREVDHLAERISGQRTESRTAGAV